MNLVVDIGNTRIKYGLFEKGELSAQGILEKAEKWDVAALIKEKGVRRSIVSSVVAHLPSFVNVLRERSNCVEYTSETKVPVKNLYRSLNTLGNDRVPTVVAAQREHPAKDILVIDAGTCIKYNFMNAGGEYLGGAISPGIEMRFKALNMFTDRLPLVPSDVAFEKLVGSSTTESILSGVMNGALEEVNGIIARYEQQYSALITVVTGGNSEFFGKRLKKSIFADPFLLLKGLNLILEYNAK